MKKVIYILMLTFPTMAYSYFVESEWGSVILSDEKCWVGQGKHAIIPSAKELSKVSILGCWEQKNDHIYIWWKKSVGADGSELPIDKIEKIKSPETLQQSQELKEINAESAINISESCKKLYQAWVYNSILEKSCNFKGNVSEEIGKDAKSECNEQLTEEMGKSLAIEVFEETKRDIAFQGEADFCKSNEQGYYELTKVK